MELTDFPGHDGKVTSDQKMIYIKGIKLEIETIAAIISVAFKTTSNCLTVFVKLVLGKVEVDRFTGPRREIDIRYEFGLKIILKGLGCK